MKSWTRLANMACSMARSGGAGIRTPDAADMSRVL
jgi:hypothetical protein